MNTQPQPATFQAPAVVVFGRDETGKAHASSFVESEVALAEKAAGLMGMSLLPVRTDAERALAAKVPRGRVFASGKGFVPFIKAALFAELEAACPPGEKAGNKLATEPAQGLAVGLGGAKHALASSVVVADEPASPQQPSNWDEIAVGSIVLAAAGPKHMEWYECAVLAVDEADLLTLRYCDWPNEPAFTRERVAVGLMHPLLQPEPPLEADEPVVAG